MWKEAQGRAMTQEPFTLLERQVNEITAAILADEPLPEEFPDCVCGHAHPHHDGYGCAAVSKGSRCICEKYRVPPQEYA